MTKKKVRRSTPKKKKFLRIVSSNFGTKGFTKTIEEMLIEAGYAKKTARQHSAILVGIKPELEKLNPLVKVMKDLRNKAVKVLKESEDKFTKASLRDLIDAIDKLTKNIQLISGKPTESVGLSLKDLFSKSKDANNK